MKTDVGADKFSELLAQAMEVAPDLMHAKALLPVLQMAALETAESLTERISHGNAQPWTLDLVEELGTSALLINPEKPLALSLSPEMIALGAQRGMIDLYQKFDPAVTSGIGRISKEALLTEEYSFLAAALTAGRDLRHGQDFPLRVLALRTWNKEELAQGAAVLLYGDQTATRIGMRLIMQHHLDPFAQLITRNKYCPSGRMISQPLASGGLAVHGELLERFAAYCATRADTPEKRTLLIRGLSAAAGRRHGLASAQAVTAAIETLGKAEVTPGALTSLTQVACELDKGPQGEQMQKAVQAASSLTCSRRLNWQETSEFLLNLGCRLHINDRKLFVRQNGKVQVGYGVPGPNDNKQDAYARPLRGAHITELFDEQAQVLVEDFAQGLDELSQSKTWGKAQNSRAEQLLIALSSAPPVNLRPKARL